MDPRDNFDEFNFYTFVNDAMEDILNSTSDQPKVVVIYFRAPFAEVDRNAYNQIIGRDGMYQRMKSRHHDGVRLMLVSLAMKEMPWIFDIEPSFPSFILLRRDLSVIQKFALEKELGSAEELLKNCKRRKVGKEEIRVLPDDLKIDQLEFKMDSLIYDELLPQMDPTNVETGVVEEKGETSANPEETGVVEEKGETSANPVETGVVEEKGETSANPQPTIPEFLRRLRSVVLEIDKDYERQRSKQY